MYLLLLAVIHAIALLAAGNALLTKKDPRSALGWSVVLVFLPVVGLALYLVFGISRAQSRAERIMQRIAAIARHYEGQVPKHPQANAPTGQEEIFERLGKRVTTQRLCLNNSVQPLHNGDEAYPAMLDAINQARDHVFLSTYIFNYGMAAQAFIKALTKAKERGVDVRVLVDGVGALYSWKKPWKILAEKGVPTHLFRPPSLFPPYFGINLRSHRKALICDETGFTGGMNIADGDVQDLAMFRDCIARQEDMPELLSQPLKQRKKKNLIQDVQFKFKGPIVNEICKAFLLNWSFCDGTISRLPLVEEGPMGRCDCRVIVDGPGNDADPLEDLICGAINLAQSEVRIMTPYFLPPAELAGSLRSASQRGVDVRVALPALNNLSYMKWAAQKILPGLLQAGVRAWYQPPPFAHTKLLVVDNFFSLVGSANLDPRSLTLNFELNVSIYSRDLAADLTKFMDSVMARGREITLARLDALPLASRLRNAACWLFSPYL